MIDHESSTIPFVRTSRISGWVVKVSRTSPFDIFGIFAKQSYRNYVAFAKENPVLASISSLIIGIVTLQPLLFGDANSLIAIDFLALLSIGANLLRRQDVSLLNIVAKRPRLVLASWFNLLALPLIIASLLSDLLIGATFFGLLLLVCFTMPIGPRVGGSGPRFKFVILSRLLPHDAIEFLSGFRTKHLRLLLIWVVTVVLAIKGHLLNEPVLMLALLGLIIWATRTVCSFYAACESTMIVQSSGDDPGKFLRRKIAIGSIVLMVIYSPILVTACMMLPEHWLLWPIAALAMQALLLNAILLKYASFKEGANRWMLQEVGIFLGSLSILLLPTFPFIEYFLQKRAMRNLDQFI